MLLTVVIPAYNCAQKLGPTLESVLAQDWPELEVVIVDDGSSDGTGALLDEYAKRDSRVRPVHIENGGPANARNVGIREAKGEYITFVDSDDLLQPDMYRSLMALVVENDLDEAACGYTMEKQSARGAPVSTPFIHPGFAAATPEEFRAKLLPLLRGHLLYVVWNKVYRAAMLREHSILFPVAYKSGEDRLFNALTLPHIRRFGFVEGPFYRYMAAPGSLNGKFLLNRFDAALSCHTAMLDAFRQMGCYDGAAAKELDFQFVKGVMSCFTQLCGGDCPLRGKEKRAYIRNVLADEAVKEAVRKREGEGGYARVVNRLLRGGNITLIRLLAKGIYLLQTRMNSLYLRVKHKS